MKHKYLYVYNRNGYKMSCEYVSRDTLWSINMMLLSDRMCIIPVKYFRRYIWSVSDSEYVTDFTIGLKCAISILEE